MVAARIPDGTPGDRADAVADLARRWSALAPDPPPVLADRLATLLRRLASVLHAEPFCPGAAREIGTELPGSGLCGEPVEPDGADVLPTTLRLLRATAADALAVTTADAPRRVQLALDELAAGFAAALARLAPPAVPGVPGTISEHHLRAVYAQGAVGVALATLDGLVLDANPALVAMLGLDGALDEPRPMSDFIHPDDLPDIAERYRRLIRGEPDTMRLDVRLVRPDAEVVWAHLVASLARHDDGSPSHLMAFVEDVSQRREFRMRLQVGSSADQLTRVPGPSTADRWLHRAFSGGSALVGICAVELDGFGSVRDAHGAAVGDRLLLGVVGRLQFAAGPHLVARAGSHRFTVLVGDPDDAGEVVRIADRLQGVLAAPFVVDGQTLSVSASIGVAAGATAATGAAELVRAAEVARGWAKALGGARRVVYDPQRDAGEAARFALLAGMRGGIGREEFRLVYQPLVGLDDGRLRGAEALVRWQHPEQGLIGPGRFIPLAEHSGAIVDLGHWVLRTACGQAARWHAELGAAAPYVSVNVSPLQLAERGYVAEVGAVLRETGLPPGKLQLEITEQAVLGDETVALDALAGLRDAGVRLALDDFGTGYSSLAWLRRLPVHALKIDGSFIDGLRHAAADPVDASIVHSLIGMAHALDLEVTAEWVETAVQAERLDALGCDLGQGRWFGDAGPGEWVPRLWRRSIDPRTAS